MTTSKRNASGARRKRKNADVARVATVKMTAIVTMTRSTSAAPTNTAAKKVLAMEVPDTAKPAVGTARAPAVMAVSLVTVSSPRATANRLRAMVVTREAMADLKDMEVVQKSMVAAQKAMVVAQKAMVVVQKAMVADSVVIAVRVAVAAIVARMMTIVAVTRVVEDMEGMVEGTKIDTE